MKYFDVFNGDADGICALHQLRLANPVESHLVTGVKRDISLLRKVHAGADDQIVVLDISMEKNRIDLLRLLDNGCVVHYFDHHVSGEIPRHENLMSIIDTGSEQCTSLLVSQYLKQRYPLWAAVGAYGDNFHKGAERVTSKLSLDDKQQQALCHLGTYLNYNGYGASLDDLFISPDELYLKIKPYSNPFDFIKEEPIFEQLQQGYLEDMQMADSLSAEYEDDYTALYLLPDERWARRVNGVFNNQLARRYPERAHATLTVLHNGDYQVSVRAPLESKTGADNLCRAFPSGGGRSAAAGINRLPKCDLGLFIDKFKAEFTL